MKKTDVIEYFGSAAKTAKALGISRTAVSRWPDVVPAFRALQIEEKSEGKLKADRNIIFKQPIEARIAPAMEGD